MIQQAEKYLAYILLFLMIASILPVMYLGRYNHPTGDDYYYGTDTKIIWEETGSVPRTFAEAFRGTARQYQIWQGTYSAMLLMHLPPNIFGEKAYRFVTPVILLLLAGGIFYLLKPVLHGLLKASKYLWLIISSLLAMLCIQTVIFQGESFFWYNGSMYYTGYFAISLFFYGAILRYLILPKKRYPYLLSFLALFLAGGNYVSLLPAMIIFLLLTAYLLWTHHTASKKMIVIFLFLIAGFLFSALAPGNQVRQNGMWKIPAWKAILKSLLQGLRYIAAWTGIWQILALVIFTPLLWKSYSKTTFQFRFPVLAVGLAYGIFCSMSCPTFYTMNSTGPARAVAIVYYGFLLFLFAAYWYLLGYVYRFFEKKGNLVAFSGKPIIGGCLWIGLTISFILIQVFSGAVSQTTMGISLHLLISGEAAAYEQEFQERLKLLNDPFITDVVLPAYKNRPAMLYVGDFSVDTEEPTNQKAAQFYHKNTLRVEYENTALP